MLTFITKLILVLLLTIGIIIVIFVIPSDTKKYVNSTNSAIMLLLVNLELTILFNNNVFFEALTVLSALDLVYILNKKQK